MLSVVDNQRGWLQSCYWHIKLSRNARNVRDIMGKIANAAPRENKEGSERWLTNPVENFSRKETIAVRRDKWQRFGSQLRNTLRRIYLVKRSLHTDSRSRASKVNTMLSRIYSVDTQIATDDETLLRKEFEDWFETCVYAHASPNKLCMEILQERWIP